MILDLNEISANALLKELKKWIILIIAIQQCQY